MPVRAVYWAEGGCAPRSKAPEPLLEAVAGASGCFGGGRVVVVWIGVCSVGRVVREVFGESEAAGRLRVPVAA